MVYDLRFLFLFLFIVKDLGGYAFWGLGFKIHQAWGVQTWRGGYVCSLLGFWVQGVLFGCPNKLWETQSFGLAYLVLFACPPKILADFMFITNNFNLSGSTWTCFQLHANWREGRSALLGTWLFMEENEWFRNWKRLFK